MRAALILAVFVGGHALAQPRPAGTCPATDCIVTGGAKGTYFWMASDLRRNLHPDLGVLPSDGSWQNLQRLAAEPGVSFAMVQSDVLNYVQLRIDQEKDPDQRARFRQLIAPLQVMMPLHVEEVHVLVHKDSPVRFLHQIKGKRIFMGRVNSGSYITGTSLYQKLFQESPEAVEVPASSFRRQSASEEIDAALINLGRLPQATPEPAVEVVILVGGQPYGAIRTLENSQVIAGNYRLVGLDPNHAPSRQLSSHYPVTTLSPSLYPVMTAGQPVRTPGVPAYLITASFTDATRNRMVRSFAADYCSGYAKLSADAQAHPKWREVPWRPGMPFPALIPGWRSVPRDVVDALTSCKGAPTASGPAPAAAAAPAQAAPKTPCQFPHPTKPGRCMDQP